MIGGVPHLIERESFEACSSFLIMLLTRMNNMTAKQPKIEVFTLKRY